MKKIKVSPGQISLFCQVIYAGKNYESLKKAMICAMQDFYIKKIYPAKIIDTGKIYYFKDMKRFWTINGFFDQYIC